MTLQTGGLLMTWLETIEVDARKEEKRKGPPLSEAG
jgi:hypothetical protein